MSRILGTLLDEGMLWHNAETGRYSLGMAVVEMAGVALGQIDVRAAAMPHMERLSASTNETIEVAVRQGGETVTVAHLPSTHSIRHVVWIGRRFPLLTTAAGKALLAAMHARGEDWRGLIGMANETRPARWERTLADDLSAVASQGYAEESDEFEVGTAAIAAPILDSSGTAAAAISISGPGVRFTAEVRDVAATLLIESVDEVAADLGMRRLAGLAGDRR